MGGKRILLCVVVVLFLFGGSLLSSLNWSLSWWRVNVKDYKPRSLQKESLGFLRLTTCAQERNGWSCLDAYQHSIVNDYSKMKWNRELDYCFRNFRKHEQSDHAVLSAAECIFTFGHSSEASADTAGNADEMDEKKVLLRFLLAMVSLLILSTVITTRSETQNIEEKVLDFSIDITDQAPKNQGSNEIIIEEESPKKLTADLREDVYNLYDEDDLKRRRSHFQEKNTQAQESAQISSPAIDTTTGPSTINLAADVPKLNMVDPTKIDVEPSRKARTDVNIHDPTKPIPSILSYPLYDKNGVPLKRIFLPGRGWCSAKQIEKEKQELFANVIPQKVPPWQVITSGAENAKLDY